MSLIPLTGEHKGLFPQLKIKDNVVHVGLSQLLELQKESLLYKELKNLIHSLNNNQLTAPKNKETKDAMEDLWTKVLLM